MRRFLWDGQIVSPALVEGVLQTSAHLFEEHGVGLWILQPLDTTELLGCGGFWFFHEPPHLEVLVSLSAAVWGQGYAQEAAGALLQHAFDVLEWPYVQGSADAPNERSLRLMRKLGMQPHGQVPGEFGTIEIYRISREGWRERRT